MDPENCTICQHPRGSHLLDNNKCGIPACTCLSYVGTPGTDDPRPPTTADTARPPPHASATPAPPAVNVPVPSDCIVTPFKLAKGRFIPMVIPSTLSKSQAERMAQFILSQADDGD